MIALIYFIEGNDPTVTIFEQWEDASIAQTNWLINTAREFEPATEIINASGAWSVFYKNDFQRDIHTWIVRAKLGATS